MKEILFGLEVIGLFIVAIFIIFKLSGILTILFTNIFHPRNHIDLTNEEIDNNAWYGLMFVAFIAVIILFAWLIGDTFYTP